MPRPAFLAAPTQTRPGTCFSVCVWSRQVQLLTIPNLQCSKREHRKSRLKQQYNSHRYVMRSCSCYNCSSYNYSCCYCGCPCRCCCRSHRCWSWTRPRLAWFPLCASKVVGETVAARRVMARVRRCGGGGRPSNAPHRRSALCHARTPASPVAEASGPPPGRHRKLRRGWLVRQPNLLSPTRCRLSINCRDGTKVAMGLRSASIHMLLNPGHCCDARSSTRHAASRRPALPLELEVGSPQRGAAAACGRPQRHLRSARPPFAAHRGLSDGRLASSAPPNSKRTVQSHSCGQFGWRCAHS